MNPGSIVLLTGLSGAGKTTIGRTVTATLREKKAYVDLLDGDDLRKSICRDLGFSEPNRRENLDRIAWVAERLSSHGIIVIIAAIAPFRDQRTALRQRIPQLREVYIRAPLNVCEARDPKGLYRACRMGQIASFTGIDSPYEEPLAPDLTCCTDQECIAESAAKVLAMLNSMKATA